MSNSHYDCPCMENCPLHYAMEKIGGKWKVQILCALNNAGVLRYNALRAKLDGDLNAGRIVLTYYSQDDLQRVWDALSRLS